MLVRLWMAEGLVHQFKSKKSMEEIGDEYFDELVSRSLIQRGPVYEKGMFKIHDLINDLATFVSAGYCLRYEDPNPNECLDRVRHLTYKMGKYDCGGKFDVIYGIKGLRTFIALPRKVADCYLAKRVMHDLLPTMRHLRVLSLSRYENITELPDSLGDLLHLRYLDLSHTKIKRLPDGTCKLYNLQTLLLSYCGSLIELPRDVDKLINLRHIDLRGTNLKEMPTNVRRLQNLRTLTTFVVGKEEDGLNVKELRNFPHLQGKLSILNLQHVVDANDGFQANLKNKEQIEKLRLEWGPNTEDSYIEREVLDKLQPSTNLKRLTISFYGGTSFPNWLGDSSFSKMVSLRISDCNHCWSLPPLGQLPALEDLGIMGLESLKSVGVDFYGKGSSSFQPFPSLESLSFDCMSNWEEWLSIGDISTEFPSLRYLTILNCPKLRGNLPNNLPSLTMLLVHGCDLLELQNFSEVGNNINTVGETKIQPKRSSDLKFMSSLQFLYLDRSPGVLSSLETGTLPALKGFNLRSYDSLQLFPRMIVSSNCLQSLHIVSMPSLMSFQNGLPASLRDLDIDKSEKLELLPVELLHNYSSLVSLHISDSCHSLESFPLGSFPVLEHLAIGNCPNLKSFIISDNSTQNLSHLKRLDVNNCPNLESFPQGGLSAPNMKEFHVYRCEKLKSLPERISTLTGLQVLTVYGLPCLTSFAEEGLPFKLQSLTVFDCRRLSTASITQWGSQRLTSLTEVMVGGDDLANSLMNKLLLPTSLVSLCIRDISFLDGKWFQHLTSLEELEIKYCPHLELLPEKGLPSSLSVLTICDCPLLEDTYQSNGGKNWPKIAHIPCIKINEEVII